MLMFLPAKLGDGLTYAPGVGIQGQDHIGLVQAGEGDNGITVLNTMLVQKGLTAAITLDHFCVRQIFCQRQATLGIALQKHNGNMVIFQSLGQIVGHTAAAAEHHPAHRAGGNA